MEVRGWRAYGITVLRVAFGVGIAWHGASKLFTTGAMEGFGGYLDGMGIPLPMFAAYVSKIAEFAGGILLVIGVFPREMALALSFNMAVAAFVAHAKHPWIGGGKSKELALTYLVAFVTIYMIGPGPCSLDPQVRKFLRNLIGKSEKEK